MSLNQISARECCCLRANHTRNSSSREKSLDSQSMRPDSPVALMPQSTLSRSQILQNSPIMLLLHHTGSGTEMLSHRAILSLFRARQVGMSIPMAARSRPLSMIYCKFLLYILYWSVSFALRHCNASSLVLNVPRCILLLLESI